ncbi:MAG: arginine repressor [Oscillospiraceae bacterium]|jgi:transcriptional regulator of arginine metabolism|nr:arginine repressor [Oscillospiraceae bacterium]
MKPKRHNIILGIIERKAIENQQQLIDALKAAGIDCTQATVSRDLRDLRLTREIDADGIYRYVPPAEGADTHSFSQYLREAVKSARAVGNLTVVRTSAGLAQAVCAAIDDMDVYGLVGTIAGEDTIFAAFEDSGAAADFSEMFTN